MIVFIVEVQQPAGPNNPSSSFRFAVLAGNEVLSISTVAKKLSFHISLIKACYAADDQTAFKDLKPYDPVLLSTGHDHLAGA